jgi:predicted DNA-binding transcriptional regulator AlpA
MAAWNKQRIANAREKLLPPHEEARLVQQYGEAIRPVLEKVLDEKAVALSKKYEESWMKFGDYLVAETREEIGQKLLSHSEAAKMIGCSVSTIKRMVAEGRLPKPVQLSEHRIGHRLADIKELVGTSRT